MVEGMRFARKHGLDFLEVSWLGSSVVPSGCRLVMGAVFFFCWLPTRPVCYRKTDVWQGGGGLLPGIGAAPGAVKQNGRFSIG